MQIEKRKIKIVCLSEIYCQNRPARHKKLEILAGCSEPLYCATLVEYSAIISAEQDASATLLGIFHPNMTKIIGEM